MSQIALIAGDHLLRARVPGQSTAGTANTWVVGTIPSNSTITGVKWIPDAAVVGAATNNFAQQVKVGAVGVTNVTTYGNGTNSVAITAEAMALSGTVADLNVAANAVIHLARTVNGTGLASPSGQVEVTYRLRGA